MKWFRFYSEVLHDSKVQMLPAELFRAWVNLLCLANEAAERGRLPDLKQVAFSLRVKEERAAQIIGQLASYGLIDSDDAGGYRPHNWDGRQHGSDDVNTRVKKHRKKKAAAAETLNETLHETLHETGTERDCNAAYPDSDSEKNNTPLPSPQGGTPAAAVSSLPPEANGDRFAAQVERARAELGDWVMTLLLSHQADIDRTLAGRVDFYLAGLHAAAAAKDTIRNPHAYAMKTARRYLDEGVTDPPIPRRPKPSTQSGF